MDGFVGGLVAVHSQAMQIGAKRMFSGCRNPLFHLNRLKDGMAHVTHHVQCGDLSLSLTEKLAADASYLPDGGTVLAVGS